jgi:hypothetical protein
MRFEVAHPVGATAEPNGGVVTDLEQLFDGVVAPSATPSPRTIRFATPPLHQGSSRSYDSPAAAADDERVARIFRDTDDVTTVLVGPNFVSVTISRPDGWERLLAPMLRIITEEFAPDDDNEDDDNEPASSGPPVKSTPAGTGSGSDREPRRLERAWAELGALRADRPDQLESVLAAVGDPEPARRQVAAALLGDAPHEVAYTAWERLLSDSSRTVRRSTVDAIAGAGREALRPLLEQALDDVDAWARWKALRGLADIGLGTSRALVDARTEDPDFRVRLEALRVRGAEPDAASAW